MAINFSETGIDNLNDGVERTKIGPGMRFNIINVKIVPSAKYDHVAHITGAQDGETLEMYTTSKVLVEQAAALLKKYGNEETGKLSDAVSVEVSEKESEKTGLRYMTFA